MARDRSPRPEAKPQRLFVGVEVPQGAKAAVERATAPIRAAFPRARWSPVGNWHVTLRFLGSTHPELLRWVDEVVASVAGAHAPVRTELTHLGSFPTATRTRVLWAGLDDASGALAAIAEDLEGRFAPAFRAESRGLTPHLTVARADPPLRLDGSLLAAKLDAPPFAVDRLVVFRSHLGRPAPRYEALARFRLTGSG